MLTNAILNSINYRFLVDGNFLKQSFTNAYNELPVNSLLLKCRYVVFTLYSNDATSLNCVVTMFQSGFQPMAYGSIAGRGTLFNGPQTLTR